jgi:PAS domain S-box-containing protein
MTVPVERAAGDRMRIPPWLRRWGDYDLALLFVAAATLLRWALSDVLKPAPTLVFYLAWVGAAAFGGLGPGLLATVASWLCIELLFEPPVGQISLADPMSIGRLVVMLAGGLVVSVVGEKMRHSRIHERRQGRELGLANAQLRAKTGELLTANEELREREQALAESRKKYRGLVERINDWVWEVDADCVYTYVSPGVRELLGYAPEEVVGKTPFDFMPLDEAERVRNAFAPIYRARQPLELLENTLVRKDGRLVIVETSGMPAFAEDGAFLGYTGIDRDVTERKRAEEALRRAKSFADRLLNAPFDTVFVFEPVTGKPMRWNRRFVEVSGYDDEEIAGMKAPDDFYDENDLKKARECTGRILADGQGTVELSLITKQGARIPFEYAATVVEDEEGKTLLLAVGRDITERKQAEEALRESEEKFRLLAETSPAAILIYQNDRYVYVNPAAESITGYRSAELLPQAPGEVVHPNFRQHVREMAARRARGEGTPTHYELKILTKDGRERWMDSETVSIMYGNRPAGLVIAFDVTERKRAEEALREWTATLESRVAERTAELEQRARQLQKLTLELTEAEERERERVAAVLHDDLQQVLAAAKFQVSLLTGGIRNPAQSQETLGRVKEMLADAIEKSRHLSHELSPALLRQGDLVETFEWLAEQMQTKHGLNVRVEARGPVQARSDAVKALMYRSAQEMLFNVVKHARVKEARLRVRRRGRYLCLSVSDRGRGFDPQEIGKTTGFGLLSIRERVALLGGRMKIRSAKGRGTTFRIIVSDVESFPRT